MAYAWVSRAVLLSISAIVSATAIGADRAADWPTKPVRLIVPFAPGGATDIVARIMAQGLADILGQQFVVDNRSGASGNIGVEMAVRSPPDGYTVVINNVSTGAINPIAFASTLKYDSTRELIGVALLASIPNLLVSGVNFPPNNIKELIEYAKARPGQLNYSNPIGAYSHLDMLEFMSKAGIQMVNVPSKGAGSSFAPVIAGEIHFSFLNAATVTPQVKAGRMKAFVTTAKKRLTELPDVPTMTEAGYPEINVVPWYGYAVPRGTPQPVVEKILAGFVEAMTSPRVRELLEKQALQPMEPMSGQELAALYAADAEKYAKVIRDTGMRRSE